MSADPQSERFHVIRTLGAGGMGIVHEAIDRQTGAHLALKRVRVSSPEALYRLKQEFRVLRDLAHPNLCALGELLEDRDDWVLTMELLEGEDILHHVRRDDAGRARCDLSRLRASMAQLAEALGVLHRAGRVHRDVKPENVLITGGGRTVLIDFGLARAMHTGDSGEPVVGTAEYMAPEQAETASVGPEADWYAFGAVLYHLLTGRPPHTGETAIEIMMAKVAQDPPAPHTLAPAVPPELDALCMALLARDPARRPRAREVLARLGVPSDTELALDADVFIGRGEELQRLDAALRTSRREAHLAAVLGPSGIGKSSLLAAFERAALASDPRTIVLAGRCFERESVSFNALDGAIDALSQVLAPDADAGAHLAGYECAALVRSFPVLARVKRIVRGSHRTVDDRDAVGRLAVAVRALRALLADLAEARPVILAIEDWQWADADSVRLLEALLVGPTAPRVLTLLTVRTGIDGADVPRIAGVETTRLELTALADDDARALAAALLGGDTSGADAIAAEGAGHPLHVAELARATSLSPQGEALTLEDAIRLRAASMPDRAQRVLECLAIASSPLPREVVAEAVGADLMGVTRTITELRMAHLVTAGATGGLEPYHDRVRTAVIEALDPQQRRAWHRAVAAACEVTRWSEDRPELLVHHLEAGGDAALAAERALQAAERAAHAHAFDRAAALYDTALQLAAPTGGDRRAVLTARAEALANAGRGIEAARVFLQAAESGTAAHRMTCRLQAAEAAIKSGHLEEGRGILRALLTEIGEPWHEGSAAILASLAWHRLGLRLRGLRFRERDADMLAARELTRLQVYRAASHGFSLVDSIRAMAYTTRYVKQALRCGDREHMVVALACEVTALAGQGKQARAEAVRERVTRLADEAGTPYLRTWAQSVVGASRYLLGDFAGARGPLAEAEAYYAESRFAGSWERTTMRLFRMFALWFLGELTELRVVYDDGVRDAQRRSDRYLETTMHRRAVILALAADDPDEARAMLQRAQWAPPEGGYHVQHCYELWARVEIALYVGGPMDPELLAELERVDRALIMRVETVRITTRWRRACLLLAAGEHGAEASKIAGQLARERPVFAHAFAAAIRAACAHQAGDAERAIAELREALAAADASHMALVAAAYRYCLSTLVDGPEADALRAEAEGWLAGQDVRVPARLVGVMAPGFASAAGAS